MGRERYSCWGERDTADGKREIQLMGREREIPDGQNLRYECYKLSVYLPQATLFYTNLCRKSLKGSRRTRKWKRGDATTETE